VVGCADFVPHVEIMAVEAFPESTNCCLGDMLSEAELRRSADAHKKRAAKGGSES
jgi:hypothetical protein